MADTVLSTYVSVRDNANATGAAIALAASALSRMSQSIDTMLTGPVDIIFYTPAQMVSHGYTLSDGSAAWGYTPNGSEIFINTSPAGVYLGPDRVQYTILHELGHQVDTDMLDHSKRVTLAGLMTPSVSTGTSGFWSAGTYVNRPSECFGDTFPRAFSDLDGVLVGYYGRQISSANHATYRSTITGVAVPATLTLASSSSIGATNLKYTGSVGTLTVGDWLLVGTGTDKSQISTIGTSGTGGTGFTVSPALTEAHSSGAAITETTAPLDPGGVVGGGPKYNITVGGVDYTRRIPSESVRVSESGSDAIATMEFTVTTNAGQTRFQYGATGDEYPQEILFTDLVNNRRLFGGFVVGATRRHVAGTSIVQEIRCVSYDSWLDRRYLANYWTTDNNLGTGNKLSDDRLIVQDIINKGKSNGALPVALVASNSTVSSTNTSMPKMNLGDGSLRDHILQVAEQASTSVDSATRRVYVDFYTNVHYYKGSEGTSAPYRIGDANYASVVSATSGIVSFWPMNERSGATAYDQKAAANMALTGNYARNVTGGVVNEPGRGATDFTGAGAGTITGAAYHPGNIFSVECWFQRRTTGTEQWLFDAGSGDYGILFTSSDTLQIIKIGTGNDFTTNATYTDTDWHHLVVTHNGSATHMYVDGVDKAGTAALKTIVAAGTTLTVATRQGGLSKFNGALQNIAFYNTAMSAATALAHYNDGMTLVPDEIEQDIDYNDAVTGVYVKGTSNSGWVNAVISHTYAATTVIDRPDVDTVSKRDNAGLAYLSREGDSVTMIRFSVTGFDGWRAGQSVVIDDATLGLSGTFAIKDIQTTFGPMGNDSLTYDISVGAMPFRGHMDITRKRRNKVGGA